MRRQVLVGVVGAGQADPELAEHCEEAEAHVEAGPCSG